MYSTFIRFLIAGLLVMAQSNVRGQSIICPANIDFSFGNFSNWSLYTGLSNCGGSCSSSSAVPIFGNAGLVTGPLAGRLIITSGAGTDAYGSFPIVAPGGGLASMRLGMDSAGYRAEAARFIIHVPAGLNDYAFTYKVAAVFNDTGFHAAGQQPAVTFRAIDSVTGLPLPCADFFWTSASPGTSRAAVVAPVRYLPWTTKVMNLNGQGGKTIIIEAAALSCGDGSHWAYGYFDIISCGRFKVVVTFCDLRKNIMTLTAPQGYANYRWYKTAPGSGTLLANGAANSTNIAPPIVPDRFYCIMTPDATGGGCVDTIQSPLLNSWTAKAFPNGACNDIDSAKVLWVEVYGKVGYKVQWTYDTALYTVFGDTGTLVHVKVPHGHNAQFPVTVYDSVGCFWRDTVMNKPKLYTLSPLRDTTICLGVSLNISPMLTPPGLGYTYRWRGRSAAQTLSDTVVAVPRYTPRAPGYDTLALFINAAGCEAMDSFRIKTLDTSITVASDTVCRHDTYIARLQGDSAFYYTWIAADSGVAVGQEHYPQPQLNTDASHSYVINISYPGCPLITRHATLTVEPRPLVDIAGDTAQVCSGQTLQLTASISPNTFPDYRFTWDTRTGLAPLGNGQAVFTGSSSALLALTVSTPHGCVGRDSVWAQVNPLPFIRLRHLDSIYVGESYQLSPATDGKTFSWSPTASLSNAAIANPVARPAQSTRYVLVATNEWGCTATDTILLHVIDDTAIVAVPNAFTPGADRNSTLKVLTRGLVKLLSFRIYNRWGNLVFQTSDITEGWDGTYKGVSQPQGVYIYMLEAGASRMNVFKKEGNVTLLR